MAMISRVHARLLWVPKDQGGRDSPPPARFVTPVRFEKYKDQWPKNAWSLVFDFSGSPEDFTFAEVSFLVQENAPQELLQPGSKFDVFGDSRFVASGEIID
jgi:hypothetical protein